MNVALPTTRSPWLLSLAALLVLGLGAAAVGQEADSPAPLAVPAGQIGAQAEALGARLEEIRARRSTEPLERIEAELQELEDTAAAAAERSETLLAGPANPVEIEDLALEWSTLERRFGALQARASDEAEAREQRVSEITDETELWRRTRSEARSKGSQAAVLRTIEEVLAKLSLAGKEIGAELDAAVALLERVYRARQGLRPTLERIEAERLALVEGLLERQAEPFWRSTPGWEEIRALPAAVGSRLAAVWAELAPDAREHRDAILVQILVFLGLAWLLSKTRAARDRRHPEMARADSDALGHPWAAALLLAVLLAPLLHGGRVRSLQLLMTPVALIAWTLMVSRIAAPSLRRPVVWVALVAALELFRFVLPGIPVLDRVLLSVELTLGLVGILWLRRPQRLQLIPWRAAASPWLRLLAAWLWLLIPALAAGLLANLLGYTTLADRIALFAIWGSVLGAAWTALVRIAEAAAAHTLEAGGFGVLRMVQTSPAAVLRGLQLGLRGLGLFAWVYATLTIAGFWSPLRSALAAVASVSVGLGEVSISLGGVLGFFLTLWLSWLIARFVSFVLEEEVFSRVRTAHGVSFAVSTFTRYAILVMGFVVAMGAIGFSMDRVALLVSALGVGIGFGLQNVVNNFVSGAILLVERPIRVGDWVQVEDLFGVVSTIGIRASKVRTFDGADVIVPNGDLISARVTNWTLSDRKRRVILPVGVAYGTPPRRVLELLAEVAHSHPAVLSEPAPSVLFRGFGDSSLNFEIRAFTEEDWLRVMSELAVSTTEALEAAGITIPFPQRDLHLRNIPELRDALKEVGQPDRPRPHDEPPS
jgi:small-conductance mechanosensitive channel